MPSGTIRRLPPSLLRGRSRRTSGLSTDASVGDTTLGVGCKLVSPEYFDLLGIDVLRGRLFASDERSPARVSS